MKHLWEVDHPYYCSEGNFYSHEPYAWHDCWDDFGMVDSDPELNLLFRWDWTPPTEEDCETIAFSEDESVKESTLQLFFVMQRKGIFCCREIKVARSEEPKIRDWLQSRLPHLLALWEPLIEQLPT